MLLLEVQAVAMLEPIIIESSIATWWIAFKPFFYLIVFILYHILVKTSIFRGSKIIIDKIGKICYNFIM